MERGFVLFLIGGSYWPTHTLNSIHNITSSPNPLPVKMRFTSACGQIKLKLKTATNTGKENTS